MRPTVLVIDDHAGFRGRARAMLEAEGFEVVAEAGDGTSGVSAAARLQPDLVLVDVGLPDLDGFAVAQRLRAGGIRSRVVLTSGRDLVDFGDRGAASVADAFIAKADLTGDRLLGVLGR